MLELTTKFPIFFNNHPFLVIGWLAIFAATIYAYFSYFFSKIKEISNAQATNLINKENAFVIDIRKADLFNHGHITGSKNVSPNDIEFQVLKKLEDNKERPIIVVCERGLESKNVAKNIYKKGFSSVYVLKDGIYGWISESLPLVKK